MYVYQLNCTWIGVFSLWRSQSFIVSYKTCADELFMHYIRDRILLLRLYFAYTWTGKTVFCFTFINRRFIFSQKNVFIQV